MVSHVISKLVNNRPVLQNTRVLPAATISVLSELKGDSDDDLFMQYSSQDFAKYDLTDDQPFYLMDPSGTCPGRYLLVSCGFGRSHTAGQVSIYLLIYLLIQPPLTILWFQSLKTQKNKSR